jgi:hypothetical protein
MLLNSQVDFKNWQDFTRNESSTCVKRIILGLLIGFGLVLLNSDYGSAIE